MDSERDKIHDSFYWESLTDETRSRLLQVWEMERQHTDDLIRSLLKDYQPIPEKSIPTTSFGAQPGLPSARPDDQNIWVPSEGLKIGPRLSTAQSTFRNGRRTLMGSSSAKHSDDSGDAANIPKFIPKPSGRKPGSRPQSIGRSDEVPPPSSPNGAIPTVYTSLPFSSGQHPTIAPPPQSPLTGFRPSSREVISRGLLMSRGQLGSPFGSLQTLREVEAFPPKPINYSKENAAYKSKKSNRARSTRRGRRGAKKRSSGRRSKSKRRGNNNSKQRRKKKSSLN